MSNSAENPESAAADTVDQPATESSSSDEARHCSEQAALDAGVPQDLELDEHWDSHALRLLINERTREGREPSSLFLGQHEAGLLKRHLSAAFGEEAASTLNRTYYMGLEVIELASPRFFRVAGKKFHSQLESIEKDIRDWRAEEFSRWQPRFGSW